MKNKINLFFTIDYKYIQHFTVTLTSILENNRDLEFIPFIITDVEPKTLHTVTEFFYHGYSTKLIILKLAPAAFERFKITDHISKATYYRLLIADIIPTSVSSGLFIDSDIVVTGSLNGLKTFEDNNTSVVAAGDAVAPDIDRLKALGFPLKQYFNAGVMFLNLNRWREINASEKLMAVASEFNDHLLWWDQDVLNMFFHEDWSALPNHYNTWDIRIRLNEMPTVIHYTGSSKPWDYKNTHPYRNEYFRYLKLTPFKNYSPFYAWTLKKINKLKKVITNV